MRAPIDLLQTSVYLTPQMQMPRYCVKQTKIIAPNTCNNSKNMTDNADYQFYDVLDTPEDCFLRRSPMIRGSTLSIDKTSVHFEAILVGYRHA